MKGTFMGLLNRTQVREEILRVWGDKRAHKIDRVSAHVLDDIEAHIRSIIRRSVASHPSVGRTFNQILLKH